MELEPEYHQYRISVPQEFEKVFTHFYFAENTSDTPVTKTLLPTYHTILLFCFGESASMMTRKKTKIVVDKSLVFGPVRQAFEYTLPANSSILVVNFKDDSFFRFFGKFSVEKWIKHPDELVPENCFTHLWHQLKEIDSTTQQVHYILEFCKPYLQHQNTTGLLLSTYENDLLNPIKVIAEQTHQTERNIQRKQKEQFGYSFKEFNRYNRFLKAIKMIEEEIEKKNKIKWFTIIDQCGYYDQSQLIHDFKHFLNISPTRYLKFQQDICNPKSE
ncbi:helix-turn-helix domain-containing protein [Chryseobacterium sp. SIMBA_028]|uniref:helix-turn-helix domain-containing protein n=1 Tax=Chryseobacterium sp. SIMBA_028 TaxID=3085771 RepID=UPI00397BA8DB